MSERPNDLYMAIAAYRSNNSDENLGNLYQGILEAEYLIPVIFDPKPVQSDEKIQLDANTKIHFYTMKNNEEKRYYLAFSDQNQLNTWFQQEKPDTITLNFQDVLKMLVKDMNVSGLLVDPAEGNMVFERELLFALQEAYQNLSN